jgi:hypothetical protein
MSWSAHEYRCGSVKLACILFLAVHCDRRSELIPVAWSADNGTSAGSDRGSAKSIAARGEQVNQMLALSRT